MQLKNGIPVLIGTISGHVFGGRYKSFVDGTRRLVGVKMAEEIDHPHQISIPTEDFSVPDVTDMQYGLIDALTAMKRGNDVYAGCMGGIGRTGLFMGCMAKVMQDLGARGTVPTMYVHDPVDFVRNHYNGHAIETEEQRRYVRTFDTAIVLRWVDQELAQKVVEVEKTVTIYPPIYVYMSWWFGGGWRNH